MKIYSPDGSLAAELPNQTMFLIPPGFKLDFSYQSPRKNYIIMCRTNIVNWNEIRRCVEIEFNGQNIEIPLMIPLPTLRREQLQDIFQRIVQLSESALPADTAAAEMLVFSILAEFPECQRLHTEQNIPEYLIGLKEVIDSDTEFQVPLSDIMKKFSVTEVHLRRQFQKYYQTSPAEYRARLRFAKIRQLLTDTDLSFKEIADQAGMNHVTHLYLFLKNHCGMTPAKLRKILKM